MISRLAALFRRFCGAHTRIEGRPVRITGSNGMLFGRVDRLTLEHDQLRIRGWAMAGQARLCAGDLEAATHIPDGGGAFDLALPWSEESDVSACVQFGTSPKTVLRLPDPRLHRLWLALRFGGLLIRLTPALVGWTLTHHPRHRHTVKRALGLEGLDTCGPLAEAVFHASSQTAPPTGTGQAAETRVTILLPVYNAHDLLLDCLGRVRDHTDLPWRMVIVEDCSTDGRIRPALRAWAGEMNAAGRNRVQVIEHDNNRGFVGAVNTGLGAIMAEPTASGPVILLNSDALVPPRWARRLVAPMLADPTVASVTPMSNDAEIFNVPSICVASQLLPGQAEAIDLVAQRLAPGTQLAEVPTGVGFCMAMNPVFLEQVPTFDMVFGRGYGEEVDWCQKTRALAGRHIGLGGLFVEHRGGASFGSQEKREAVAANNLIISRRYPAYDGEVQRFIRDDPLLSARMALAMAWAGTLGPESEPVPIYLGHSLGGGAEHWLCAKLAEHQGPSVVLRVGGIARWRIEVHVGGEMTAATTGNFDLVKQLLEPLKVRHILYSCGVGDTDPLGLPDCLLQLKANPGDRLEILFHDFLPISPSYTLLDADGAFRGAVTPERINTQERRGKTGNHRAVDAKGQPVTLKTWQAAWGTLLMAADEIRVFSDAGRALVTASWPQIAKSIHVKPHSLLHEVPRLTPLADTTRPVVAALGNIAPHKGAALLCKLGRRLKGRHQPRLILIGEIDPGYSLPRHVHVHGRYHVPEIPDLVARYGITHWLIPSVWPETFSFATHEALATGLPVLAFDIGAQGEAVAAAENGRIMVYDPSADLVERVLEALSQSPTAGPHNHAAEPVKEMP